MPGDRDAHEREHRQGVHAAGLRRHLELPRRRIGDDLLPVRRIDAPDLEGGTDQVDEEDEELKHKLPAVSEGEALKFRSIDPEQHFTEPPPRYNEATLVKELEADGVGRPSTYASILSTILEREYVTKEGGRFTPTELGMVVTDLLLECFDDIFDVKYTARMEQELDEIEDGKLDWRQAIQEFYDKFSVDLERAGTQTNDPTRSTRPPYER